MVPGVGIWALRAPKGAERESSLLTSYWSESTTSTRYRRGLGEAFSYERGTPVGYRGCRNPVVEYAFSAVHPQSALTTQFSRTRDTFTASLPHTSNT